VLQADGEGVTHSKPQRHEASSKMSIELWMKQEKRLQDPSLQQMQTAIVMDPGGLACGLLVSCFDALCRCTRDKIK
jgi:hypothetical protein